MVLPLFRDTNKKTSFRIKNNTASDFVAAKHTMMPSSSSRQHQRHCWLEIPYQQLAANRQFDAIEAALRNETSQNALSHWLRGEIDSPLANGTPHENDDDEEVLGTYDSTDDGDMEPQWHGTPLHYIAAVHPPVSLVALLMDTVSVLFPRTAPLDAMDLVGRTPLHIATTYGCPSAVVLQLLDASGNSTSAAVLMQDAWHRCPLHWACMNTMMKGNLEEEYPSFHDHNDDDDDKSKSNRKKSWMAMLLGCGRKPAAASVAAAICWSNDDLVRTVELLVRSFPEATLLRDCNGKTPLDLAVDHDVDPRIVDLVHETVERVGRQQQRNWSKTSKDICCNHDDYYESDATSSTDLESFPTGFPGEITMHDDNSFDDDDDDEGFAKLPPEYTEQRMVSSMRFSDSKVQFDYLRFEC